MLKATPILLGLLLASSADCATRVVPELLLIHLKHQPSPLNSIDANKIVLSKDLIRERSSTSELVVLRQGKKCRITALGGEPVITKIGKRFALSSPVRVGPTDISISGSNAVTSLVGITIRCDGTPAENEKLTVSDLYSDLDNAIRFE
jgi:hypothetical protein